MKVLSLLAKKLPKQSTGRLIVESALQGVVENEQRFERERSEFERKRDERRAKWAKRHPSDS